MLLLVAVAIAVVTIPIARLRRIDMRASTRVLLATGTIMLSVAAGGPALVRPQSGYVAVMVDVSGSTRTAAFRDRDALATRMDQLLGSARYRLLHFAEHPERATLDQTIDEIPSQRTTFEPPFDADAVLLFSDGQFDPPLMAPPVYAVVDPKLDAAPDARIERLEIREKELAAAVVNQGASRDLTFSHDQHKRSIDPGTIVVTHSIPQIASPTTARLNPTDAWPENDALTIHPPPPEQLERWWVGLSSPSAEWSSIAPADLPTDAASYLRAAVIVLENVPSDAFSSAQRARLLQYVRDLGGSVVIVGGDRAFAAGAYIGTSLETLSPLSSHPPGPSTHWILLADSSGSMASAAVAGTRWQLVVDAIGKTLAHLPPEDLATLGSFAREVRWWSQGRSARDTQAIALSSADVSPHGPTNLQPAIESIIASTDGTMPIELLVLSDADTKLDVDALVGTMRQKNIRMHLLATSDPDAGNPVRLLAEATGGLFLVESDPKQWADRARDLAQSAMREPIVDKPIQLRFVQKLSSAGEITARRWNRVWSKDGATSLAIDTAEPQRVLSAMWNFGAGQVGAAAFEAPVQIVNAIAALIEAAPRDPRLRIRWDVASELRVTIDAIEDEGFINALTFELQLRDATDPARIVETHQIRQTAPGQYELALTAPRMPVIATVRLKNSAVDRRAIAGRYPAEFAAIGNNRQRLHELSTRTGGRLVEPGEATELDLRRSDHRRDIAAPVAAAGVLLIAMGLIHWRLR